MKMTNIQDMIRFILELERRIIALEMSKTQQTADVAKEQQTVVKATSEVGLTKSEKTSLRMKQYWADRRAKVDG